jgi:photosystem II stability/assembly factor-like uncharacterized protein
MKVLALLGTILLGGCSPDDSFSLPFSLGDMAPLDMAPLDIGHDLAPPADPSPLAWAPETSGTGSALYGVWGASSTDVWAVGLGNTILHTTNGGKSWSTVIATSFAGDWYAVGGSGANDVFIVGTAGTTIHSANGGASWSDVSPPSRGSMAVLGFPSGDVYVLGSADLAHTKDGGMSWGMVKPPAGGSAMIGLWGAVAAELYIAGAAGLILYTSDGGASWTVKSGPNTLLNGVGGSSSGGDVYIVGDGNSVLHSSDHGATWTLQNSSLSPVSGLIAVSVPADDDVIVVGALGTAMLAAMSSHDRGATWAPLDLGTTSALQAIWSAGPRDVYAVGAHGAILHAH